MISASVFQSKFTVCCFNNVISLNFNPSTFHVAANLMAKIFLG